MIRDNSEAFFDELDESLILVGEEVMPSEAVDNRIDLLAVDRTGRTVILELKRGNDKYQLLQSLGYAAMSADWDDQALLEQASRFWQCDLESATTRLEDFLDTDLRALNEEQRVVLLAEGFDYEVLATASWLTEVYGLDIRCFRVTIARHEEDELLQCVRVFPARTLTEQAVLRRRSGRTGRSKLLPAATDNLATWNDLLASVRNPEVKSFFEDELAAGRTNYLPDRSVVFQDRSRNRWYVKVRTEQAYVWQEGRFAQDVGFWQKQLPRDADIRAVQGGRALRFYLNSAEAFQAFRRAVLDDGSKLEFLSTQRLNNMLDTDELDGKINDSFEQESS
ncbi:MAG: hypothetical protein AAGH99_09340 [Planctomycetota bacterium]